MNNLRVVHQMFGNKIKIVCNRTCICFSFHSFIFVKLLLCYLKFVMEKVALGQDNLFTILNKDTMLRVRNTLSL